MTIIDKATEKIEELRQALPPGKTVEEVWRNKRRALTISVGDEVVTKTDFMSSMQTIYWIKGYLARHEEEWTFQSTRVPESPYFDLVEQSQKPSENALDPAEYFAEFIERTK